MKYKIFIDGHYGTTGLKIYDNHEQYLKVGKRIISLI